ncbi:aspartic proteinase cdr1 [Phtheirospermum japonicum]|uniref:Aspartic proteinase cdr1 n=1 Tax=Phtheirospermum japonicum TaxID=374723 RepID=A0A830BXM7_9LAMI|nr:aspartic proteinase cdr1 [Phtheirospermum japonicum]
MLRRSLKRAQRLNSTARSPERIADTGSDLIWTQCHPCHQGFNQTLPIFNPKTSSTYKKIPCSALRCSSFPETSCSRSRKNCLYSGAYGDGSFTKGELSTDTITLASSPGGENTVSIPNVVLGCGFKNGIKFEGGESGIIGLGGGKVSFVRQLGSGKFSYCLVPFTEKSNSSSKLSFGANAVVSGRGVGSTPIPRKQIDTFYYATLLGISVGNQKLEMYDASSNSTQEGNIIVDSGTTMTILPGDFYAKLKSAMQSRIKLKQIEDPTGVLDLCFHTRDKVRIPDITVHFKGADLKWKQENIFVRLSDVALCLAAQPARDVAIFGNLAQTNFLVGYDLEKRTLSFKPTDCTKH